MTQHVTQALAQDAHHHHHNSDRMDVFGFWIYILSDCILFGIIFATYAVLCTSVYDGPQLKELIDLKYVLVETILLLMSSFTYGLAILALYKNRLPHVVMWLGLTFLLGLSFVIMEVKEFVDLYLEGHGWQSNAAMSSFFTLVGTHGLHVSFGLLWIAVMIVQLMVFKITPTIRRRLTYLGLFWTFLDIVWIFVFTLVYLMGAA